MSYTHYWHVNNDVTGLDPRWRRVIEDARKMIARSEIPLSGNDDENGYFGEPVIEDDYILFNGRGDDACEDFEIPLGYFPIKPDHTRKQWGYCSTNRRQYDQMVCAVLISVKHHFGSDVQIHSNGDLDKEWLFGADMDGASPIRLYTYVFPDRTLPFPIIG